MEKQIRDLKQRTYKYALGVIQYLEDLPRGYITETLAKQLLRSATSVGANVVEAQSSSSRKDFTNFYTHALKSANESKFWLTLLRDSGKNGSERLPQLLNETNELSRILASSILSLKGRKSF